MSQFIPTSCSEIDTLALHGVGGPDGWASALITPLVQSTTFVQGEIGSHTGHCYSRVSNPTVDALEKSLGGLEKAPPAVAFSTGLAAETALFFSLLKQGDHCVIGDAVYGGTVRLFQQLLSDLGVTHTFVDSSNAAKVAAAITPRTKLVFIESPANPTLKLTDIAAVAKVTRAAGIPLAVDNTFLTAAIQQPLELGADISVYSTTKHIEGRSTALGGAIVTRDENLLKRLKFIRKCTGAIQTPFNAWLTLRGLSTLPLRLRQHSANAQIIAEWLEQHPGVACVYYPGLADFPNHALARKQHRNGQHGGVIAFEVVGGVPGGIGVLNRVKLCALVEHIGSVETLITHPASMTHGDVPKAQREAVGISDGLIRLSVGLEDPTDVIRDLDQAIRGAVQACSESVPAIAGRCCSEASVQKERASCLIA